MASMAASSRSNPPGAARTSRDRARKEKMWRSVLAVIVELASSVWGIFAAMGERQSMGFVRVA
jgi:hypothetical protein